LRDRPIPQTADHPPNYLATDYDCDITIRLVRFLRALMSQPAIAPYVVGELGDSALSNGDDEILDFMRRRGTSAYHAVGTCAMGPDSDRNAVLDERLRVRGVTGLRVVDCSVMPQRVSANTNGPVMAVVARCGHDPCRPAAIVRVLPSRLKPLRRRSAVHVVASPHDAPAARSVLTGRGRAYSVRSALTVT
jgi:choline dehydrogenase-like flavoprotein